jgi:diguanylate cyclase (GGDEF)-like protein
MLNRLCFPVAVTALVSLLVFQGSAVADAPVSLSLPTLPGSPSVTVTNVGGGAGAEVGAGDTAVGVGAGTSGVGVTTHARGTSQPKSSPDLGEPVSAPVIAPRRPAGDGRLAQPGSGGAGGTVFGPGLGGKAAGTAAARSGKPGRAVRNGPKTSPVRQDEQSVTPDVGRTTPWPFYELVDRIPAAVWAGFGALFAVALALWFGWVKDRRRLSRNAFVDPVTGTANAAAFTGMLDRELDRATRYKRPLGLLLLDVSEPDREDGKLLRLRDTTRREASEAISAGIREADTIAALGSDRFAVICPEATAVSVQTLARALERRLEDLRIHVKVGVAERDGTDESAGDLLARAEADLAAQRPAAPRRRLERILHAA